MNEEVLWKKIMYIIYVKELTEALPEIEVRKNNGNPAFTRG